MTADTQNFNKRGLNTPPSPEISDSKKSGQSGILAYMFLPGIIPQIKQLSSSGFGYLAMLIAMIYQVVKILPADHPYTKYENIGKFGIRHVVAAAANNIQFGKKNIDQIIIFFAILAGIILLLLQFVGFIILLFSGDAWAASTDGIFATQNPDTDIAFHMMREVFGIPDMFGTLEGGQTPFHKALQTLFRFYNLALLVVAILVFIYYVIVVVAETAQTGTPFGQRFSHIYAPFRLVIAIGLLVPLNYGFNGSQYLALYAAKIGSGFATTGWVQFNDALSESNPFGAENATLIAETKAPDFKGLVSFMGVVTTCREAYKIKEATGVTRKEITAEVSYQEGDAMKSLPLADDSYETIAVSKNMKDITVMFGAREPSGKGSNAFTPYCGTVVIPINVSMEASTNGNGDPGGLQKKYLTTIKTLWDHDKLKQLGIDIAIAFHVITGSGMSCSTPNDCMPDLNRQEPIISETKTAIEKSVKDHYKAAREDADFKMREDTKKRGWGGAGIWYNRIAQINGAYVTATMNIPAGDKWPEVMQRVLEAKKGADGSSSVCNTFEPNLADSHQYRSADAAKETYYAKVFNASYKYWNCEKKTTSNFFLDALSAVFGLGGLMSIRDELETTDDAGNITKTAIHPLAKLSALGKGLIEAAIRNMGFAMGTSFLGGMAGVLGPNLGAALSAASSFFVSIATIGLSIGFITYYILPFLPFIYFFFSVGGWVKSIFEAMVGAPLWALAHLRIDGDGIPGKMAMNGYFLIFEIFLRPILTVFGLLGGMAIFTALATMLNELFDLVVVNTAGVDLQKEDDSLFSRHIVDVFFFTVIYTVILYMMAVSSFKMITLVPNNILRWLGTGVSAFSDQTQDPTQGLTQYAAIGGQRIGGQLAGGMTKLSEGGGNVIGSVFGMGKNSGQGGR